MYLYWHNFVTGEMEPRLEAPSKDEMSKFIPQVDAAQGLYKTYLAMGKDYLEAAIATLEACLGAQTA